MFTGMLEMVADVHQLTIILGHEMAHALLGHAVSIKRLLAHGIILFIGMLGTQVLITLKVTCLQALKHNSSDFGVEHVGTRSALQTMSSAPHNVASRSRLHPAVIGLFVSRSQFSLR